MRILYKNPDNSLSILIPAPACLKNHTIEEIALKDIPQGTPFWIVDNSEIPTDRTFRDAWELPENYREPDGYGSPFNSFKEIEDASN
jgi:hypothetical protein